MDALNSFLRRSNNRLKTLILDYLIITGNSWKSLLNSIAAMPVLESLTIAGIRGIFVEDWVAMGISRILSEVKTLREFKFSDKWVQLPMNFLIDALAQATTLKLLDWRAPLNGYYKEFGQTVASLPNLESFSIGFEGNQQNLRDLIASFVNFSGPLRELKWRNHMDPELYSDLASKIPFLESLESLEVDFSQEQSIRSFCDTLVSAAKRPPRLSKLILGGELINVHYWEQDSRYSFLGLLEMLQRRPVVGLNELVVDIELPLDFAKQILLVSGTGQSIVRNVLPGKSVLHKIQKIKLGLRHPENHLPESTEWKSFARVLGKCDRLETFGIYFKRRHSMNLDRVGWMLSHHAPKRLDRIIIDDVCEYIKSGETGKFISISKNPIKKIIQREDSFRESIEKIRQDCQSQPSESNSYCYNGTVKKLVWPMVYAILTIIGINKIFQEDDKGDFFDVD